MRAHAATAARAIRIRLVAVTVMVTALSACARGCAGADELAFCEAIERNNVAAAQQLLDAGRVNIVARNFSGKCQPIMVAFEAAHARSPYEAEQSKALTALVVGLAKREGIANTCWTTPSTSSSSRPGGRQSVSGERCPLDTAVDNVNPAVLRALIDAGVDLRRHNANNDLVTASMQGSLEIVRMMVEGGSDPNWGITGAVANRQEAVVAYLESKGAREDVDELLIAARRGDLPAIDAAIAKRANLNATDGGGRTPLIRAALYGHPEAVVKLAKAGAQVDAMTDGQTALHFAANENRVEVIRALIAAGAKVDVRPDPSANTPLNAAVINSAVQAVAALVDAGADANAGPDNDTTPLGTAIVHGHLALTRELLRGGARINDKRGLAQQPAIHASLGICARPLEGDTQNDNYRVALLRTVVEAGADRTAKNASGETAIEVVSKALGAAQGDFYKACHGAKLEYLKSLR